jgi:hypothetical protein
MMSIPIAHVAGIPIEETIGIYGPALLLAFAAACTIAKARLRRVRGGRASDRRVDDRRHDRAASETKRDA